MGRSVVSLIFDAARDEWRRVRAEYALFLEAQYDAALEECSGVLLNERGKAAGVSSFSLFSGSRVRAAAYASEELLDFWQRHPRMPFCVFERQSYERAEVPPDGR